MRYESSLNAHELGLKLSSSGKTILFSLVWWKAGMKMGYKAILYCDGYLQSCRLSAVKLIYNNPRVHLSHAKSTYSQNLQYDFSVSSSPQLLSSTLSQRQFYLLPSHMTTQVPHALQSNRSTTTPSISNPINCAQNLISPLFWSSIILLRSGTL